MPNDWFWCCWRCCVGWSIFHMGSCHPLKRTIILFCFSTFQNVTQTISVAWDNPEIKAVQFISTKINCKDSDLLLESVPHFLLVYSCPSLFYTVPFWLFGGFFLFQLAMKSTNLEIAADFDQMSLKQTAIPLKLSAEEH